MGGHQGGETASRMALDVLRERVEAAHPDLDGAAKAIDEARRLELLRTTDTMPTLETAERASTPGDRERSGALRGSLGRAGGVAALARGLEGQGPYRGLVDDGNEPTMEAVLPPALTVMRQAAREAGRAIFDAALDDPGLRGMGTTLTAMLYEGGRMHVVHAGDSRCYLFRDGALRQITDDHSWIAEQVRSGNMTEAEARESKFRHVITRSVGFERDVDVDTRGIVAEAGDCYLLCSDGMSNYVDNAELERLLAVTWYRRAPQALIDLANQRGGDDNITVVVVMIAND